MHHVRGCFNYIDWWLCCRDEIQELYVQIQGLMDFVEVNRTGFRKALKKHDKVLNVPCSLNLSPQY